MNYTDTINWMFQQLPMYQNKGKSAFKKDLTNSINFAKHLKHPEKKFKSVHVAGTNGKGSTSHMLASILQEAGYQVGLYTSPHLKDFRERIKINGHKVSKAYVIQFIKTNKKFLEDHQLSFFEMTVAMAFDYFAQKKVDIAIIEVGLGGRLDSTNIITPEVSVITNIGFDHTQFLGNTMEAIAYEKAGIIKPLIPAVIGETHPETQAVFRNTAKAQQADLYFADKVSYNHYQTDLLGEYQQKNIKAVLKTIDILNSKGFLINSSSIKKGLLNVVHNTGLMGRYQVLNEEPKVVCDIAHNREGLELVMQQIGNENFENLHMVLGFVNDKDLNTLVSVLPNAATYYLCRPNVQRGLDVNELYKFFSDNGFSATSYQSAQDAYDSALEKASKSDLIYIGGSTFVVAELV